MIKALLEDYEALISAQPSTFQEVIEIYEDTVLWEIHSISLYDEIINSDSPLVEDFVGAYMDCVLYGLPRFRERYHTIMAIKEGYAVSEKQFIEELRSNIV